MNFVQALYAFALQQHPATGIKNCALKFEVFMESEERKKPNSSTKILTFQNVFVVFSVRFGFCSFFN